MNTSFLLVFVCIFGTMIGSFLNVVILRFNTGRGIDGRSGCFTCGTTLHWYELIPIISFVFLRGRCSSCKSVISIQYPLVELANGLLYTFLCYRLWISASSLYDSVPLILGSIALSFTLWSSLLVIFVYDLRHKIIPELFSILFFLSSLAVTLLSVYISHDIVILYNHLKAALMLFSFFLFLYMVSGGRWMGFGDVKLAIGIGMYLGIAQGLSAIAYAFWIGAMYAIISLSTQYLYQRMGTKYFHLGTKHLTMKSEIPFAPFLIVGTFLAFACASDVFHITFLFNA